MNSALSFPADGRYMLAGGRLHRSLAVGALGAEDVDGFALADIVVEEGKIAALGPPGPSWRRDHGVELGGRIVMPAFVDCHTHIDKGHIWPRKPNPDGSFAAALRSKCRGSQHALDGRGRGARGWISRCAPPTPTAPRHSGRI